MPIARGQGRLSSSSGLGRSSDVFHPSVDKVTNGGFETAGAGGADIWANWTETAADGALADETSVVNSGSHAAKITTGVGGTTNIRQRITVIPTMRCKLTFYTRGSGTAALRYLVSDFTHGSVAIIATTSSGVAAAAYALVTAYFVVPVACTQIDISFYCAPGNGQSVYVDDAALYYLTV